MHTLKVSILLMAVGALFVSPGVSHAADVKSGAVLYKKFCQPCHGAEGKGDGPNSENMDPPPRDLTDSGKEKYMVHRTNGELLKAIYIGGSKIEKSGMMPPFGKTLSEDEIWSIIAYIQTLYMPSKKPVVDLKRAYNTKRPEIKVIATTIEPPDRKAKMRGKRVYDKFGCSGCHSINGKGGSTGPDLSGIASKLKADQIYSVTQNARSVNADSKMPVYDLGEASAVAITRYLLTLE